MLRRMLLTGLLVFSLLAAPLASWADEGMWLPNSLGKLPLSQLKKRGFELKPEEVYSESAPSLKDAIVQISIGGTGSFVSPDGLILTNHHVAFSAVTSASSTENDYITKGFLAKSREAEIPAAGYSISITQDFKNVTAEVLEAVKPGMSPDERTRAISARQQELSRAAAKGREKEGIRTQVIEATGGYEYYLYTYLTLRDVRLVYAPPKSIGYYGGDPDNFEWPRHCGDFAFLRAYVGSDGKPAMFDKSNVPFKPKKFLAINANGVREGDFTMIMGYPGRTMRYRESYSIDFNQHVQLPAQVSALRQQIETLTRLGESNPALKIRLADQIFGLSNSLKNFEGSILGLKRMDLIARKQAEEAAFRKWLDANPAQKEKYGEILPQIEELYRELNSYGLKQNALNNLLNAGDLVNTLEFIWGRALDKEKPAGEQSQQFGDMAAQRVTQQIAMMWGERQPEAEIKLLAGALAIAASLPANQKIGAIEKLFGQESGAARRKAEEEFATKAISAGRFTTPDSVKSLLDSSAAELRAIDDPLLKLVGQAYEENRPLTDRSRVFNNRILRLRPEYVRGMLEMKKGLYYPDANFTLRWTYGEVKGYQPRDAVTYDYQTSLRGVIEKDTGLEPFDVPARLKELYQKKDYGSYVDARLKDVPVAFLATTDITGGNSGSPVMNGRGEVIGLAFDGNYEGLGGDYNFDLSSNRTLAVDIRYVLFLVEKYAGAGYLFEEMQIRRGKK
ncbi:MAG: S46 family peptidase [Acidobacteriota bacterium]